MNGDHYDWGNNCKLLGFTAEEAACGLAIDTGTTQEQRDDFWYGFVDGTNTEIVSIKARLPELGKLAEEGLRLMFREEWLQVRYEIDDDFGHDYSV